MDKAKEVVYQIYPKSFQDTTGSGMGDLQGIISRLDYLQALGVTYIWLNPIFPSPQVDNGYDVADYCAINPDFGTMEDFEQLVQEAHARGIHIMLDMVFNHTSTKHPWFQKALAGDEKYKDYYIWKDAKADGSLPTNWESKFGGPVWQYVPEVGQYYLHLFAPEQADLNWENPAVRAELKNVLNFWLDKGVRGFRFDVINLISKDAYEDDFEGVGKRFYTDGKNVDPWLQELFDGSLSRFDTLSVGEMSATTVDHCAQYTNPKNRELDMTFSFHHLKVDYKNKEKWTLMDFDFQELKDLFFDWDVEMDEKGGWNALFWNCHDQPRSLSRFGDDTNYPLESGKMLANVIHTRKGTPYIYMGEELGMTSNNFHSLDQFRDVESLNYARILKEEGKSDGEILAILNAKSRDNARSPMQWDAAGGFTTGTPWMDINPNTASIHARAALEDENSLFHHYQKLIALRKENPVIQQGHTIPLLQDHPSILAYKRVLDDQEILCVHNFYGNACDLPLEHLEDYRLLLSSYPDSSVHTGMKLRPYESLILEKMI